MAKKRPKKPRVNAPKTRERIRKTARRINDLLRKMEKAGAISTTRDLLEIDAGMKKPKITTGDPTRPRVSKTAPLLSDPAERKKQTKELSERAKRLEKIERELKKEWAEHKKHWPKPTLPKKPRVPAPVPPPGPKDLDWWDKIYDQFNGFYDSDRIGEIVSEFDSRIDIDPLLIWIKLVEYDPEYLWSTERTQAEKIFLQAWYYMNYLPPLTHDPEFAEFLVNEIGLDAANHPDFNDFIETYKETHDESEWPEWVN